MSEVNEDFCLTPQSIWKHEILALSGHQGLQVYMPPTRVPYWNLSKLVGPLGQAKSNFLLGSRPVLPLLPELTLVLVAAAAEEEDDFEVAGLVVVGAAAAEEECEVVEVVLATCEEEARGVVVAAGVEVLAAALVEGVALAATREVVLGRHRLARFAMLRLRFAMLS